MKAVFLSTGTNECPKYATSLQALGWDITYQRYDLPDLPEQLIYSRVKEQSPDLVVYIGSRWGKVPATATLCQIKDRIAPSVHICSDAADIPWHDMLRDYRDKGCFSVQVAIDGSHKWPHSAADITALTPVEPSLFAAAPMPHAERHILCGYAGNPGAGVGKRTEMLSALLERQVIDQLHIRSNLPHTNDMYCRFLGLCRMSINIAWTGTEACLHVKGRVLESGLAGAVLLETAGAPTSYWFRPGLDYLEYKDSEDAEQIVERLAHEPEATQAMGMSLRARVLAEHSPQVFWNRILERLGISVVA